MIFSLKHTGTRLGKGRFFTFPLILLALNLVACDAGFGRSNNADLQRLSITPTITLDPDFDSDETDYTARVSRDIATLTFNATTDDEDATMTLNGETFLNDIDAVVPLDIGVNTIDIRVTAENESTQTYRFRITRLEESSDDAFLSSLVLENIVIDETFNADDFDYGASTNFFVNSTRVTIRRSNEQAVVVFNGQTLSDANPSEEVALDTIGDNNLSLAVTAGDRTTENEYTVTVDRADKDQLQVPTYIKAANPGADDNFGFALAIYENRLLIGAPGEDSASESSQSNDSAADAGAAYVFENAGGVWSAEQYLKAFPISAGDLFGSGVALGDEILAVGAPGTNANSGAVHIFEFSNSEWNHEQLISASDASTDDEFGTAISMQGDLLIVGAPGRGSDRGAVYVFSRDGGEWHEDQIVQADNGESGDRFGATVHINRHIGDDENPEFAIGAPQEASSSGDDKADNSRVGAGAVYVYQRVEESADAWQQRAYVKASNADAGDNFGTSISILGNRLAAGAPNEASDATGVDGSAADNSMVGAGAAYVFIREDQDDGWDDEVYFKATQSDDMNFGTSVALSAAMLAVGAPLEDSNAINVGGNDNDDNAEDAGAVYVFEFTGNTWASEIYVKSSNTDAGDLFGEAIVFSSENLFVGAQTEDSSNGGVDSTPNDEGDDTGAVYIVR